MIKVIIIVLLSAFFCPAPALSDYMDDSRLQAILRSVSRPKLIYPANEEIDLSQKGELEFRWELYSAAMVARDSIEFRLYSGDKIEETKLIMAKRLAPEIYSLKMDAGGFENGAVYTWMIRQFVLRGEYAGEGAASFKVIKKNVSVGNPQ